MKRYTCQFKITALFVAWMYRRRGYQTNISRVKHYYNEGGRLCVQYGYRVRGWRIKE